MSYNTIHKCAHDPQFFARIEAACAQEGEPEPNASAYKTIYPISVASDVEAAYASALAAANPNPGGDESVISDGMILAHLQPLLPATTQAPPTPQV